MEMPSLRCCFFIIHRLPKPLAKAHNCEVTSETCFSPSSSHGVTTVVMGNCAVGFAPCRKEDHDLLINVTESVEDIPGVVMSEGLRFRRKADRIELLKANRDTRCPLLDNRRQKAALLLKPEKTRTANKMYAAKGD